ncbi:MAG: hypothetical protein KAV87_19705 [Desulfobacteraceae bacterium]|nr:hypothetical protein [Desulfobacteraceae bacterium]
MSNKLIYNTPALEKKTNLRNIDLTEWNYVCTFGSCLIYANDDRRRLIKAETGEIVFEYTIGIHDAGLNKNSNISRVKKRERNVRL